MTSSRVQTDPATGPFLYSGSALSRRINRGKERTSSLLPANTDGSTLDFNLTYALPSVVDFSRASSGTYIDSQGKVRTAASDVPRFDHDPISLKPLGLLSEAPATNFLCWSNSLNTSGGANNWIHSQVTFLGLVEAPSGLLEAPAFTAYDAGYQAGVSNFPNITTSGTWTFSVWVMRVDETDGSGEVMVMVDEDNYIEEEIPSKTWIRLSVTGFTASPNPGVFSWRSGTKFAVWGAQLEAGSAASSLIVTDSSLSTRAGDFASLSGKSLAVAVDRSQGTFLVVGDRYDSTPTVSRMMTLQDTTAFNNEISASIASNGGRLRIIHRGASQAQITGVAPFIQAAAVRRVAFRYGTNDAFVSVNGFPGSLDISVIVPEFDIMRIGHVAISSTAWDWTRGHISRIKYWPFKFGNAQLAALSAG